MGNGCWCPNTIESIHDFQISDIETEINSKRSSSQLKALRKFSSDDIDFTASEMSSMRISQNIRYIKGEMIGEGSYAKVYQCLSIDTGNLYAVKCIKFDPRHINKELKTIKQEINLLSQLDHKNIIKYYQSDINFVDSSVEILMEYIPSGSLKKIISKYGRLETGVIRHYTLQILKSLVYLQSKGIIHRDLKPANILINNDGTVKLIDFGSSKKIGLSDFKLTNSMKGSPY